MFSPADVANLVGREVFARGQDYVQRGMVLSVAHKPGGNTIVGQVRGSSGKQYVAVIEMSAAGVTGSPRYGRCSCPVRLNCKHTVATLLAYRAKHTELPKQEATADSDDEWERTFAHLLQPTEPAPAVVKDDGSPDLTRVTPVALQIELEAGVPPRLAMTPAIMGQTGRWMRSNISWQDIRFLGYRHGSSVPPDHVEVLQTICGLAGASSSYYGPPKVIHADEIHGSALWAVLDDAQRVGLPIIGRDREQTPVLMQERPARTELAITQQKSGLAVTATVQLDDEVAGLRPADPEHTVLLGKPALGLFIWADPAPAAKTGTKKAALTAPTRESTLALARLRTAPDDTVRSLLDRKAPLVIPEEAAERFLLRVLPALRARVDAVVIDPAVKLPAAPKPSLWLQATRLPDHVTSLSWQWRYYTDPESSADAATDADSDPVWPPQHEPAFTVPLGVPVTDTMRDQQAETTILQEVAGQCPRLMDVLEADAQQRSSLFRLPEQRDAQGGFAAVELRGMDTAQFFTEELPHLRALGQTRTDLGVEVTSQGAVDLIDYRYATDVDVEVSTTELDDSRDWFGLGVTIRAGQQVVPFADVFTAIANGKTHLLLVDGLHFSLDDERFTRLKELIDEAKALQDTMGDTLRVSRYQAGLFEELEHLGLLGAQAETWRNSVAALADGGQIEPLDPPPGLNATLRPYQQEGFEWLAFLAKHQLGGVLADDMGLGKTVQGLALIEHLLGGERPAGSKRGAPFLIVAPTSVVGNWQAEAKHFTPGLTAVAITETRKRRKAPLQDAIAGADIVITSYALFRLGFEEYDDVEWSGLILDEAQFIKNHQSVAYQCARRLLAPIKVAMTGTPLENNLMELWSILSVVSPGLFPHPGRFTEYYARPIERNADADKLEQFRRRVAPFMLRRTKEAVASDLPVKQEQVLEVELNSKHRKIYDRYLQRERAKVLGLIDELNEHRFEVFRSLTLLRQASLDVSLVDSEHEDIPSSKLDVLSEMLEGILADDHSVLIFSQFTQFLGKVRDRLDAAGVEYSYLDGRTRKRTETIERFTSGETKVFLISLKAGGFGLNLTAADYCILLDPWWNPAAEAQAVDRAHRIGQVRPVNVYRMVSADTIEEKVMALKAGKSALFTSVLEGGTARTSGITAQDVRELLG